MAVKIRLKRIGTRNSPVHRIVVADGRNPRDGRNIEELGTYWPLQAGADNFNLDLGRAEYWLGVGARPSDTVRSIIRKARRAAQGLTLPVSKLKKKPEPSKEEVKEEIPAETVEEVATEDLQVDAPAEEVKVEEGTAVGEPQTDKAQADGDVPGEETKAEQEKSSEEAKAEEEVDEEAPAEKPKAEQKKPAEDASEEEQAAEGKEEKKTGEKPAE